MRLLRALGAALPLLTLPFAVLAFGSAPPAKSGPAVIPYLCADGRPANVVYEGGSNPRHAKARITYDGRTIEMRAAPALYGVRYRGEAASGPALAWSLRGEEARLTESPDEASYAGEEPVIAHCVRLRGAGAGTPAKAGGHGDDH